MTHANIYYHGPVVALDLDDTLFSEREHAVAAYGAVSRCEPFCRAGVSADVLAVMTTALDNRQNPFDAVEEWLSVRGLCMPDDTAARLQIYRQYEPRELTLYPDASVLLEQLHLRGVPMALITDGRSHTQRAKIRALGIEHYFNPVDIFISEETGHDKTDLDNFTALVHHYPEASRFIYVGDNTAKDFSVPSLLGWECYCLRERAGNIHRQGECGDAQIIESLTEIIEKINI